MFQKSDFVYIPRKDSSLAKIPCLLLTHIYSTKLMIYLHGNGEDLIMCSPILHEIRLKLQINILAVEYPGYQQNYIQKSVRSQPDVSVEQILSDVLEVYTFLYDTIGILNKELIIYGRSIGSGFSL